MLKQASSKRRLSAGSAGKPSSTAGKSSAAPLKQPTLPFEHGEFDFVFIAVSVQYLVQPLALFSDIARVLSPGGCLVVAMSHRCFPSKAIRAFHGADGAARMALVKQYCVHAAAFSDIESIDRSPPNVDPLWLVTARTAPRS